jgi:hypothetical protein
MQTLRTVWQARGDRRGRKRPGAGTVALVCGATVALFGGVQAAGAAPKLPTTTSVSFSAFPAAGSQVTVTATITPSNATGTVSFTALLGKSKVMLPASCASAPVSGGSASCAFTPTSTGTYTFNANFTDAKTYASSKGSGSVVVKLASSTAVSFSAAPTVGSPVTVTATLAPAAATGTVAFAATTAGSGLALPAGCASAAISGGQASCTFTPATADSYKFTASYAGDASYAGSAGSGTVSPALPATQTTISFSASPTPGSPLTVTATVAPAAATGTVDFATTLAGDPVALPASCTAAPLSSGQATCVFTPNAAGRYDFTAGYSGDATYAHSTGSGSATVRAETATLVTDNATTVPGGPAPVTFGGTIVFTATVSTTGGTPDGTVRWTLSADGPDYASSGSGTIGACQGDVPVVNGVATCDVTPGTWDDGGNGDLPTPYYWGIRATATFTPADGSPLYGSSGNDATTKITLGPSFCMGTYPDPYKSCAQAQSPYIQVDLGGQTVRLWVDPSDSLGRAMSFTWDVDLLGAVVTDAPWVDMLVEPGDSFTSGALSTVCPAGVTPYSGSFECLYPDPSYYGIVLKNEPS